MPCNLEEKTVSSEFPFSGKLIKIEVDKVILPNGRESQRELVLHRGAVAIAAVEQGKVLLERQYRHTASRVLWEIPAGTLEEGEIPEECARRELKEETGYVAEKLVKLIRFYVAPGYSKEVIHLFLATGLKKSEASPEYDEFIETSFIPIEEAMEMVYRNIIEDSKTIIGLLLLKEMH
jgi:ADP-ribose pyrophosphatase